MKTITICILLSVFTVNRDDIDIRNTRIDGEFKLPNTAAPLNYEDYLALATNASAYLPVKDGAFVEHVRAICPSAEQDALAEIFNAKSKELQASRFVSMVGAPITCLVQQGNIWWIGTNKGLFVFNSETRTIARHESYGTNGPLATSINSLALDSRNTLWIGTPVGLSLFKPDASWEGIRGAEGLPVEEITALEIDSRDRIWLGTNQGAILYTPYEKGRQWYYRAGKRYLINDEISDIKMSGDERAVFFKTRHGISKLEIVERTLSQKADIMEARLNQWHRRLGLVAACQFDDPEHPTSATIKDNDNDGLWTSYHVVAMSLAYATTGKEAYRESARKGMHALIMLQNASGIPGLVARSVLPIEEKGRLSAQWRETPDGNRMWKSDTSSDEIDGHFFAFYAYWEHIARHDPEEDKLIKKQISTVINYIVDNNYQLIDWDGKRTRWGFWNPESLNDDPEHYIENGLNSAQILSFLKVSWYITGNPKFKKHYDYLITEHGYLGNLLLEKKVFPDLDNHSDNQLGFVALYPLLQLEFDPRAREALQRAVRRHYMTLSRDGSAFFYFAAATIDPDFVDIAAAVENLRQIHTDRRQWEMINSRRKDIVWNPRNDRFDRPQLLNVLPADERNFDRWNHNPYYADGGKGGQHEDDGGSWLLAYWIGRHHGFIGE